MKKKNKRKYGFAIALCVISVLLLTTYHFCVINYNLTFESLLSLLLVPVEGTGAGMIKQIVFLYLKSLLRFGACFGLIAFLALQRRVIVNVELRIFKKKYVIRPLVVLRRLWTPFCAVLAVFSCAFVVKEFGILTYFQRIRASTQIFETYYVAPKNAEIQTPAEKKNLIYIYLESMETSYASKENGGMQDEINYIPELTELTDQHTTFSHCDTTLGGFYDVTGTNATAASLFASTSGLPYCFTGISWNTREEFAGGVNTLGDILEEAGYQQMFICGSDGDYGNRAKYFEQHGDYEVVDLYAAQEKGYIPENYHNGWWGYDDATLYEIAKEELTRMAAAQQPFNLTLLTVDTHTYGGYVCDLCQEMYEYQLANVIFCADRQIADFLIWCREQPFYADTVIVIQGDHTQRDATLVEGTGRNDRTVYHCIVNGPEADESVTKNRLFTAIDFFPTTLSALGFEIPGAQLGMGVDLYSGEKTLAEQLGLDYLREEFAKYSEFYLQTFT